MHLMFIWSERYIIIYNDISKENSCMQGYSSLFQIEKVFNTSCFLQNILLRNSHNKKKFSWPKPSRAPVMP